MLSEAPPVIMDDPSHCASALLRLEDQRERDMALNGLKQGRLRVLVATDVAARGLDIKGVGFTTASRAVSARTEADCRPTSVEPR